LDEESINYKLYLHLTFLSFSKVGNFGKAFLFYIHTIKTLGLLNFASITKKSLLNKT